MRLPPLRATLLAATALIGSSGAAWAQSTDRLSAIQAQIRELNAELARVKRDVAAKDAAVRQAQQDAARARQTAEQTQQAVANLPMPAGFKQGNGGPAAPSLGMYAAHPDYPSPQTDWTSLNSSPVSASDEKAGATGHKGEFHIGGVTIQLGGFIDGDAVYRTRNEVTDVASNFNTRHPAAPERAIPRGRVPRIRAARAGSRS